MELITEITEFSWYIYYCREDYCVNDENVPEFCKLIREFAPTVCGKGCPTGEKVHMCNAGLWLRSFPIKIDDQRIGYIIVGHRRLFERDDESRQMLNFLFDKYSICRIEKIKIMEMFEKVPQASIREFESKLFLKIPRLQEYVIKEHLRMISERNRADLLEIKARNLEKASEEISVRSTLAAHEFQIPIQAMVGLNEFLLNCIKNNNIVICAEINRSAESIAEELLERLVKLSFIAENLRNVDNLNLRYDFVKLNYIDILNSTIQLFQSEAHKKGIAIREIEEQGRPVHLIEGSENHIKQLLFNVIHNSVKYSFLPPKGGERFIRVICKELENNMICIEVVNFGIGILEEELEKIFQKGYRGKLAGDRSRIGSGLGLWLAKQIVIDHRGKIEIDSEKMGVGTKSDPYVTSVKVYLPIVQPRR